MGTVNEVACVEGDLQGIGIWEVRFGEVLGDAVPELALGIGGAGGGLSEGSVEVSGLGFECDDESIPLIVVGGADAAAISGCFGDAMPPVAERLVNGSALGKLVPSFLCDLREGGALFG